MIYDLLLPATPAATTLLVAAIVAIAGLWAGAEGATAAAKRIARGLGVTELVIGLTLVSIASSLPEILVNISAVLGDASDIAAGNVVGSCFVQISLVLGLCAVFAGRLSLRPRERLRDGLAVVLANLVFIAVAFDGFAGRVEGLALVVAYAVYLAIIVRTAHPPEAEAQPDSDVARRERAPGRLADVVSGLSRPAGSARAAVT